MVPVVCILPEHSVVPLCSTGTLPIPELALVKEHRNPGTDRVVGIPKQRREWVHYDCSSSNRQ